MEYEKISPDSQLSHTIETYAFLKTKEPASFSDTFFPNGKPALVFHFKTPFSFRNPAGTMTRLPQAVFIGFQAVPVSLQTDGVIDSITVLLHPCALYNLFKLRLQESFNYMDAAGYIPEWLIEKLAHNTVSVERAEALNVFFADKLKEYDPAGDTLRTICDYIITNKGVNERKDLSDIFSLSENYIHKLFIKRLGISVKPYSRVVRVSNIIAEVYATANHDWIEMLMRYGYFDQAHFIKDFKSITGKTPKQYYQSDKKLSSVFSALA